MHLMNAGSPEQDGRTIEELWDGPIPADLARKRSGVKPQFLVAGLLLVGVIVALMIYGLTTAKAYWLTVDEVQQRGGALTSQPLRVNGVVVDGSEDWNATQGHVALHDGGRGRSRSPIGGRLLPTAAGQLPAGSLGHCVGGAIGRRHLSGRCPCTSNVPAATRKRRKKSSARLPVEPGGLLPRRAGSGFSGMRAEIFCPLPRLRLLCRLGMRYDCIANGQNARRSVQPVSWRSS